MHKELCNRCHGFGCSDCRATGFQVSKEVPSCRFCGASAWIAEDSVDSCTSYECGNCHAIRWFNPRKARYVQDKSASRSAQTVTSYTAQTIQTPNLAPPTHTAQTAQRLFPLSCPCGADDWRADGNRQYINGAGTLVTEAKWVCAQCNRSTLVTQSP